MRELIREQVLNAMHALQKKEGVDLAFPEISIERPKEVMHGDWTTNIAFSLAKDLKRSPFEIAQQLVDLMDDRPEIDQIVTVSPGYINFVLAKSIIEKEIEEILQEKKEYGMNDLLKEQKVMVEYTQPNPFKPFHIGHLMSNAIGESVSRIIAFSGAEVVRANYQGDVGPHVAKALWGLKKRGYDPTDIDKIGEAYAYGHAASEDDPKAQEEIKKINADVYKGEDEELMEIYRKGREKTLERFEEIYALLGTSFDQYYFESQTWQEGEKIVREHVGGIFTESDGAIVFNGEQYGLHTRVFITAQGLPTYEAKELGLAFLKKRTCPSDTYVITTAVEQEEYFKVVKKAIELVDPSFEGKITHIPHGMMQLVSGKMSSRKGNVITGESLIADAQAVAQKKISERVGEDHDVGSTIDTIAIGGIKFNILKQRTGKNITFDPETALSFDGDNGPYVQYTYARCQSILDHAQEKKIHMTCKDVCSDGQDVSRILVQFPEIVAHACSEYAPHYIANYLLELVHAFNGYYTENIIIDENDKERSAHRVALTAATAQVIENGMRLLGIKVPDKM